MEPIHVTSPGASSLRDVSCIDTSKKMLKWLPIPCLGLAALGGTGFGFSALFATSSTVTLQASAIASAAFDFSVVVISLFSCGCYYKNMPEKTFEENVKRQEKENIILGDLEKEIDISVDTIALKNKQLEYALKEAEEKAKALKEQLDKNVEHLLKSNGDLDKSIVSFEKIQKDFIKSKAALSEAKDLVTSLMKLSLVMKEDLKTSKVIVEMLSKENQGFKKEVASIDHENLELASLLKQYGQVIASEHTQFLYLTDAYQKLDNFYQELKNEVETLSKHSQQISLDISQDKLNIAQLQGLANRLTKLTDKID